MILTTGKGINLTIDSQTKELKALWTCIMYTYLEQYLLFSKVIPILSQWYLKKNQSHI